MASEEDRRIYGEEQTAGTAINLGQMMLVAEHGQCHCIAGARSSLFYGDDSSFCPEEGIPVSASLYLLPAYILATARR